MTIDESWKYLSPTKIVFGLRSFETIKKYILALNIHKKILLVTGQSSMQQYGYVGRLKKILYDKSLYHFSGISPNPTCADIERGLHFVGSKQFELVIALGGGSALDAGKVLAIMLNNPGSVKEYLDGRKDFQNPSLPFIAVPTTSGTASEVTCWSTLWDTVKKEKHSVSHSWMFPDYAVIDPVLTTHMSPRLTAVTGLDALTHAIEACWSQNSQPISDVFALRAIKLIRQNLKRAVNEPDNLEARSNMSLASLFAGLAFNNTKTAACHSLSYTMTLNFDIPHGLAVSLTIPEVIKINYRAMPRKVDQIVEEFGASSVDDFIQQLVDLMKSGGLPTRLRDLGLKEKDIGTLLAGGINPDRMKNNPVQLSMEDIRGILLNTY